MLLVQFGQPSFEIVAHQRGRQVRRALYDANAEIAEGLAEFTLSVHVERMNAYPALAQVFLGDLGRQPKAGPIAGHSIGRSARCRQDVAPLDQPLERFLDFLGGKKRLEFTNEFSKAPAALCYRGGEGAIKLAVEKELPILGIQADHVRWQHIDGEIGRELRNVLAGIPREVNTLACHRFSTRSSTNMDWPGRFCRTRP